MRADADQAAMLARRFARSAGLRRFAWSALATCLLLGPTVLLERWASSHVDRLWPYLQQEQAWGDTKRLLFAREACPDALSLGTSMTVASLFQHDLQRADLQPRIARTFQYALSANKVLPMYAAWRSALDRGCHPNWVFIEVSPSALSRSADRVRRYLPPVFSLSVWRNAPDGAFETGKLRRRDLIEFLTWGGLLISRRRTELGEFAADSLRGATRDARTPPPRHGELQPASTKRFVGKRRARSIVMRGRQVRRRGFDYPIDVRSVEILRVLADEVRRAGGRPILHTPPVSDIYLDALVTLKVKKRWCAAGALIRTRVDAPWFDDFDGKAYEGKLLHDWDHTNRWGAARYVERLARSIRTGHFRSSDYCG